MNKRQRRKHRLELKVRQLESEIFVLSRENMDLYDKVMEYKTELNSLRQAQERHEAECSQNVQATNAEFSKIRYEMKRLKKPFWKR
ncbi:hypothetical protein SORDD17_01368 [Streptococcus oralis]|uniref:Uncharacterized protein n=1 Tax=Streptococcus oralis TaxID=1303 RepID=A0A139RIL5_STROR|nr:hypothetical protein [Streptococcus oralis]KXU14590.1 hypothetical protein SORDD17_01368 [Streptococcus oralis]